MKDITLELFMAKEHKGYMHSVCFDFKRKFKDEEEYKENLYHFLMFKAKYCPDGTLPEIDPKTDRFGFLMSSVLPPEKSKYSIAYLPKEDSFIVAYRTDKKEGFNVEIAFKNKDLMMVRAQAYYSSTDDTHIQLLNLMGVLKYKLSDYARVSYFDKVNDFGNVNSIGDGVRDNLTEPMVFEAKNAYEKNRHYKFSLFNDFYPHKTVSGYHYNPDLSVINKEIEIPNAPQNYINYIMPSYVINHHGIRLDISESTYTLMHDDYFLRNDVLPFTKLSEFHHATYNVSSQTENLVGIELHDGILVKAFATPDGKAIALGIPLFDVSELFSKYPEEFSGISSQYRTANVNMGNVDLSDSYRYSLGYAGQTSKLTYKHSNESQSFYIINTLAIDYYLAGNNGPELKDERVFFKDKDGRYYRLVTVFGFNVVH